MKVTTDGGSRGNPGPSASGIVITHNDGTPIHAFGTYLGHTTNNVAEYTAVLEALRWLQEHKATLPAEPVEFSLDSLLVVSQLNGVYKMKNPTLREIMLQIKDQELLLGLPVSYTHIKREQNTAADAMVNETLDNHS